MYRSRGKVCMSSAVEESVLCLDEPEVVATDQQNDDIEAVIDVETFRRAGDFILVASVCVQTAIEINFSDIGAAHSLRDVVFEHPTI